MRISDWSSDVCSSDLLTATGGLRAYKYKNSLVGFFGYSANVSPKTGVAGCFADAIVSGTPCTNLDKVTSDTGVIPKLNLTYKITPGVMVYATDRKSTRLNSSH